MNREIKFQVIHNGKIFGVERLNNGRWEWMCYELNPGKGERWCYGVFNDNTDLIRRQYTGLKDSKGVEIFEGDLCERNIDGFFGVVRYEVQAGCYWLYSESEKRYRNLAEGSQYGDEHGITLASLTVIGNIYQHPELLK